MPTHLAASLGQIADQGQPERVFTRRYGDHLPWSKKQYWASGVTKEHQRNAEELSRPTGNDRRLR